jgi:tetratricopeptide (TPR) repeat protein
MSAEALRLQGNEAFQASNFLLAEECYRQALEIDPSSHLLFTNLAAAYLELKKFEEAIEAADRAILIEMTWTKAYFRKASAFESMGKTRESYLTWAAAFRVCETTPWLRKQFERSKIMWLHEFQIEPVLNHSDLLERYLLLTDSREKLSTLAHFWNLSTPEERMKHFTFFLSMIGGQNPSSESSLGISIEMMHPMPMHNYHDLPEDRIRSWCGFFKSVDSTTKTLILEQLWYTLTSKEQNDVVLDLQLFMSRATHSSPISKEEN